MNNDCLNNIVFLIPSLDPDENMGIYVNKLINEGCKNIVIVNDGSNKENEHYFNELKDKKEIIVLTHEVNKGKGRALKTGIEYVANNMPNIVGVVTADADGQHSPKDTIKVANRLLETNDVVFGTRNFNLDIVPFKSRNGNKITTFVFKLLYGKTINDTQTGLRGLPIEFAKECLNVNGERFEYEIGMLIKAVRDGYEIIEEPIDTIYINSNRATHFNAVKDSFKIYKVMLKEFFTFIMSSLLSTIVDFIIYSLLVKTIFDPDIISIGILCSTAIARVISCTVNYLLNKKKVFKVDDSIGSVNRYFILAILQMLTSSLLVTVLYNITGFESIIIKCVVDTILFFVSYRIQRVWVFK